LICPGAPKAGTTSLYRILGMHPDIYVSEFKEIYFFGNLRNYNKGVEWYKRYFRGYKGQRYVADVTPFYLDSEKAPERIKDTLGLDVKFVIMLRNPADRAFSHYLMQSRERGGVTSFEDILKNNARNSREQSIISNGFFHRNISRYLRIFPEENFHFIFMDDLYADFHRVASDLFSFLGVDDIEIEANVFENQRFMPKRKLLFRLLKKIPNRYKVMLKKAFGLKTGNDATRRMAGEAMTGRDEMPDEIRKLLVGIYEEDIRELGNMLGRDLSKWLEY